MQAVADDVCPRPDLVAAISKLRETVSVDHPRVRRPDAAALRVDDAWVVGRVEPAVPPMSSVGPRGRKLAVESLAFWYRAVHAPADVARSIDGDDVLAGRAETIGGAQGFVDSAGELERHDGLGQPIGRM